MIMRLAPEATPEVVRNANSVKPASELVAVKIEVKGRGGNPVVNRLSMFLHFHNIISVGTTDILESAYLSGFKH